MLKDQGTHKSSTGSNILLYKNFKNLEISWKLTERNRFNCDMIMECLKARVTEFFQRKQ